MYTTLHSTRRREPGSPRGRSVLASLLWLALLSLMITPGPAAAQGTIDPEPPLCPFIQDPAPTADKPMRPSSSLDDGEYRFVHSSTHLQGAPAFDKYAVGLMWNPPSPATLAGFQSVVVVTNPNPVQTKVTVTFFDQGGVPRGSYTFILPAEGFETVPASSLAAGSPAGLGSAWIHSEDAEIVGETIHHLTSVNLTGFGGPFVTDPDPGSPGAASAQQLQLLQEGKTALFFGPIPISDQSPIDFLDGLAAQVWIMNPNPTPTTVQVGIFSRLGVSLGTTTTVVPARASLVDLRLWDTLWSAYLSGAINYDDDFVVVATGNQPILGEVLMADLFGSGTSGNLEQDKRFRLGSAMMANTPALRVIDPELTYDTSQWGVETVLGITNAAPVDIGPVTIEYFDRDGGSLGSSTIASFPQAAVARIGPGLPQSPNFPPPNLFDGWIRITACKSGLLGWTMRTSGDVGQFGSLTYHKVWGEALAGANGAEPGDGFKVAAGGQTWLRKVAPIVRVMPPGFWPGYTAIVDHASSDIGPYLFRFLTKAGADVTDFTNQPFPALPFGFTSLSYEDPEVNSSLVMGATNLSERVDRSKGLIQGIHVLGDPLDEWGIFNHYPAPNSTPVPVNPVQPLDP